MGLNIVHPDGKVKGFYKQPGFLTLILVPPLACYDRLHTNRIRPKHRHKCITLLVGSGVLSLPGKGQSINLYCHRSTVNREV